MEIRDIKTPEDILTFMKEHIEYGWLDINNEEHVKTMKGFRKLYRTSTIQETLEHGLGTCIEQVYLMSNLLNNIDIPNKMFCTRIYEGKDFNNLEAEEHMHCFVLYYKDGKVYQIEHPDPTRRGIHGFDSEELAIKAMERYYQKFYGGYLRPAVEFFDIPKGLTFDELNAYINTLEEERDKKKELNQ